MESILNDEAVVEELRNPATEKLLSELKALLVRAQQKTVERAKATDQVIRDHPYETIGVAFGLGLLVGLLACRK